MKIKRSASVVWAGGLKDGKGEISTQTGALKSCPYGFASRFEGTAGSNPEELLAAAHAACFTMALSLALGEAGLTAERMETDAVVSLEQKDGGFAITSSALTLKATDSGCRRCHVPEGGGVGEGKLPGVEIVRYRNQPERDAGLTVACGRRSRLARGLGSGDHPFHPLRASPHNILMEAASAHRLSRASPDI